MKKVLLRIVAGLEMYLEQIREFNTNFKKLVNYMAFFVEEPLADKLPKPTPEPDSNPEERYLESEMLTIKMVCSILKVSRSKLYDFKEKGELTFFERPGGGIRLCPEEVERLRYCYSVPKGKV